MPQFLVNLNDATTGHKLQGMSLDSLMVPSFPNKILRALFKHWVYVVLSSLRTLSGLYLLNKIDEDDSFKPTEYFVRFLKRTQKKTKTLKKKREKLWSHLNSPNQLRD